MSDTGYGFEFAEPAPLGVTIFLVIYNFILLVAVIVGVPFIIMRRENKYLAARTPSTLAFVHVGVMVQVIIQSISIIVGKPAFCTTLDWLYTISPAVSLHYTLNIPALVYASDVNDAKINRASGNLSDAVWKYTRFCTVPAKWGYIFAVLVMQAVAFIGVKYGVDPELIPGDCNRAALMVMSAHLIVFMVVLMYFMVRVSKVVDPFYMQKENRAGTLGNLAIVFLVWLYPFKPELFPPWFDFRWTVIIIPITSVTTGLIFPVLLTHPPFEAWLNGKMLTQLEEEDAKELATKETIFALNQGLDIFQAVLNHPVLLEAFTQFTVKQWSVENVLFYRAVEEFKAEFDRRDSATNTKRAREIVAEFILDGAPLQVNLDAKVVARMTRLSSTDLEREVVEKHLFNEAQAMIVELMKKDSFERFKVTKEFKKALESIVDKSSHSGSSQRNSSSFGMEIEITA